MRRLKDDLDASTTRAADRRSKRRCRIAAMVATGTRRSTSGSGGGGLGVMDGIASSSSSMDGVPASPSRVVGDDDVQAEPKRFVAG